MNSDIETIIEEFVKNAREDRTTADKTYRDLLKIEEFASIAASFFRAKQDANKQLLDAAQLILKEREHKLRAERFLKDSSAEDELSDIYNDIHNSSYDER